MTGRPRILFFGAGAVGSFLGGRLAREGCEVTLVGRSPHVEVVARNGVRLAGADKETTQAVRAAVATVADTQGPFDYVLLTVKGFDTLDAVEQVQPVLQPGTILGSFQNGVGNEEAIAAAVPDQALFSATLTVPVSLEQPGLVHQHGHRGGVAAAPVSPEVNVAPLLRLFAEAGFVASRYSDYRSMKWSKLLLNMLANAQSAILELPPRHIFADAELFRYERLAFREAVRVMDRMRLPAVPLPGYSVPGLRRIMSLPTPLAQMILSPQAGGARGGKMPSLWWDLKQAKGRTEARFLNGAVVEAGSRFDVATPVNSVLWAIVEQVTASPSEWDRYRRRPDRLKALLGTAARL